MCNKKSKTTAEDIEAGKRLRAIRKAKKVRVADIANHLGKSYQQIQKYEIGRNRISGDTLYKIAQFLNVPMEYFYDRELKRNTLSTDELGALATQEKQRIKQSLNRQIYRHIDWGVSAMEAELFEKEQNTEASAYFTVIEGISTAQIIRLTQEVLEELAKDTNDN